ncbi:MAG: hypothetical protein JSR77_12945 [Planctomycetes bacterium]|nr:hypothetical protein [Planctomycetota bacterium]
MKVISQFVVHVCDLLEAEGRELRAVVRGESEQLRMGLARMAAAVTVLTASMILCLAGVGLLGIGLLLWLEPHVGRPLAAGLTGVALLALSAAGFTGFRVLSRRYVP